MLLNWPVFRVFIREGVTLVNNKKSGKKTGGKEAGPGKLISNRGAISGDSGKGQGAREPQAGWTWGGLEVPGGGTEDTSPSPSEIGSGPRRTLTHSNLWRISASLFEPNVDNCWEAQSQQIEITLWRRAGLHRFTQKKEYSFIPQMQKENGLR